MLRVFISYSHQDKDLLAELNTHLATLRRLALIEHWTDQEIQSGTEWEPDIWSHFNSADILILLISADFIASNFCYRLEFEAAEQRSRRKEVRLLPVIVRDCDWKDGRLDRLQCFCADKPVALYGDKRTDRDAGWKRVVTEIRTVVTQMAAAPKPRRAASGDEEDSEGDLVPLLCNRQAQEELFFEKFIGAAPGAPQIYFLPGAEDALHDSFITRVQQDIVPKLLGEEFESLRHVTQWIRAKWAEKPPTGRELPFLIAQLAFQIDRKLKPDAVLIKQHPKVAASIVIIRHQLYAKHWNDNMSALLRDYVAFWSRAASDDNRPLFLIFFNVIFNETVSPDAPQLACLAALAAELDGKPCCVAVLDPLGGIEWEQVDTWRANYFPQRPHHDEPLRELFAAKSIQPMKKVEVALREFAGH